MTRFPLTSALKIHTGNTAQTKMLCIAQLKRKCCYIMQLFPHRNNLGFFLSPPFDHIIKTFFQFRQTFFFFFGFITLAFPFPQFCSEQTACTHTCTHIHPFLSLSAFSNNLHIMEQPEGGLINDLCLRDAVPRETHLPT